MALEARVRNAYEVSVCVCVPARLVYGVWCLVCMHIRGLPVNTGCSTSELPERWNVAPTTYIKCQPSSLHRGACLERLGEIKIARGLIDAVAVTERVNACGSGGVRRGRREKASDARTDDDLESLALCVVDHRVEIRVIEGREDAAAHDGELVVRKHDACDKSKRRRDQRRRETQRNAPV